MENIMDLIATLPSRKQLLIATAIGFFMLLTRGSHALTSFALPDASIALFLFGGLYLRRLSWFIMFFVLATLIDFGAAALDPAQGFCLTNGYWGLIPSYGVMWLGGYWLDKQTDSFSAIKYLSVSILTSFLAFIISTQTYYLFSGRFPNRGVIETLQFGWGYLASWMGYAALYFAFAWLTVTLLRSIKPAQTFKI
jgi:hypothetical protein